jgi:hypothetical protein
MKLDNMSFQFCRFCDPESSKIYRHEMALDANGRRLLVTSGSVRAPIYQVYLSLPPSLHVHSHRLVQTQSSGFHLLVLFTPIRIYLLTYSSRSICLLELQK